MYFDKNPFILWVCRGWLLISREILSIRIFRKNEWFFGEIFFPFWSTFNLNKIPLMQLNPKPKYIIHQWCQLHIIFTLRIWIGEHARLFIFQKDSIMFGLIESLFANWIFQKLGKKFICFVNFQYFVYFILKILWEA